MSIAKAIPLACERGAAVGAHVIQIFTKNERQWKASPIPEDVPAAFRKAMKEHDIHTAFAHDTYLINLASGDPELWRKSLDAFVHELERCETLGLSFLVTHPGAPGKTGAESGIRNMVKGLNEAHRRTKGIRTRILLETTAGQGTVLGRTFDELKAMRDGLKEPERLGFCFDTCHVLAAGYDFRKKAGYDRVMGDFDELLGLESIEAFHLNDSKKDLGSRVDRHEHIGQGFVGKTAFRLLLNDKRFAKVPKVLETPKADDMDVVNLRLLRSLIRGRKKA